MNLLCQFNLLIREDLNTHNNYYVQVLKTNVLKEICFRPNQNINEGFLI